MTAMLPLPSLLRASAWDTGNDHMRQHGRKKWDEDDYNAAAGEQNRLVATCYGEGPMGCIKFAIATQLEKAGLLTIGLSDADFFGLLEDAYAHAGIE